LAQREYTAGTLYMHATTDSHSDEMMNCNDLSASENQLKPA